MRQGKEWVLSLRTPDTAQMKITLDLQQNGNPVLLTLRCLEQQSLFAALNRSLKFRSPALRDEENLLQIVSKTLVSPQCSKGRLRKLPRQSLEAMAYYAVLFSANVHSPPCPKNLLEEASLNTLLNIITVLEEVSQFDPATWLSEDMASQSLHSTLPLPEVSFKPGNEVLTKWLRLQGYEDLFLRDTCPDDPWLGYWLSRKLAFPLPWEVVLSNFPQSMSTLFPYLYRFQIIYQYLLTDPTTCELLSEAGKTPLPLWLKSMLPLVRQWISERFPQFSQAAQISRPVRQLILVEGNTEALLLPVFGELIGRDFNRHGIHVMAVGGKNQMLEQYVHYSRQVSIPIRIILDHDAMPLLPALNQYRREMDSFTVIETGEFEDLYPLNLILKTINETYHPDLQVTAEAFQEPLPRVRQLQKVWQDYGLGVFDKIEFAEHLILVLRDMDVLPPEVEAFLSEISVLPLGTSDDSIQR